MWSFSQGCVFFCYRGIEDISKVIDISYQGCSIVILQCTMFEISQCWLRMRATSKTGAHFWQRQDCLFVPTQIRKNQLQNCMSMWHGPTQKIICTCDVQYMDHVSYGGPRPIYRPMYRLIQWSIHRSILDRVSVDTRSSIGQYIGGVSTDVSIDTLIGRYTWRFTDTSPILHWVYW